MLPGFSLGTLWQYHVKIPERSHSKKWEMPVKSVKIKRTMEELNYQKAGGFIFWFFLPVPTGFRCQCMNTKARAWNSQ